MAWALRENIASWNASNWSTSVDFNGSPRLSVIRSGLPRFSGSIAPHDKGEPVGDARLTLGDSYVREGDLVATYPEKAPFRFGFETYFSALAADEQMLSLELWLSVQTSTLEAHPQLFIEFSSEASKLRAGNETGIYRTEDGRSAFLVHPLDANDVVLESPELDAQRIVALGRFMEKGVIRRLRARLLVSTSSIDDGTLHQAFLDFAKSPLPLTT